MGFYSARRRFERGAGEIRFCPRACAAEIGRGWKHGVIKACLAWCGARAVVAVVAFRGVSDARSWLFGGLAHERMCALLISVC